MITEQMLENQLNREIICLLAVCSIPPTEKRVWVNLLPDMTDAEKEALKTNLGAEAEYETKVSEDAVAKFIEALNKVA